MLAERLAFRAENGFHAAVEAAAARDGVLLSDFIREAVRKRLDEVGVRIDQRQRRPLPRRSRAPAQVQA